MQEIAPGDATESQLGLLNLTVFVLSVYVLLAILVDTVFALPAQTSFASR